MSFGGVENLRISIGDAVRLFGLTPRALRFYEEQGLVNARRGANNARYYDLDARRRLDWISRLRRCEVPLGEIRGVLDADDPAARRKLALDTLQARRTALERALDEIGRLATSLVDEPLESPSRLRRSACR